MVLARSAILSCVALAVALQSPLAVSAQAKAPPAAAQPAAGTWNYRTAKVVRGDMKPTIEATGTLEPEEVVNIGAQVNGPITEVRVDYNSKVEKDDVLAVIDPLMYQAAVDQNQAALNRAKADLAQMKANAVLRRPI